MIKITTITTLIIACVSLISQQPVDAFDWQLAGSNEYVQFTSTLTVPNQFPIRPAGKRPTYFLWPGLQTNKFANNYLPIGYGVLQPVLTWGIACTPNQPAGFDPYASWWISAQYVNPTSTVADYKGCLGGTIMKVDFGDDLILDMRKTGTVWTQTVTSSKTGKSVNFVLDMKGQGQNRAELVIELYNGAVVDFDVVFKDITLVTNMKEPIGQAGFCTDDSSTLQTRETCSGMTIGMDGKTCKIQQCLFAAPPAPPTPTTSSGASPTTDPTTSSDPTDTGMSIPNSLPTETDAPPIPGQGTTTGQSSSSPTDTTNGNGTSLGGNGKGVGGSSGNGNGSGSGSGVATVTRSDSKSGAGASFVRLQNSFAVEGVLALSFLVCVLGLAV
ncbi:hypothetical protein HDU76_013571 [Blyttiomyces sp. JEL0837]|nr:hypothetical protein HDU76_013571 [Blyttiomyces sp. JEL0837]